MRDTRSSHDSCCANGTWADTNFDGIGAGFNELGGPFEGGYIACEDIDLRQASLHFLDGVDDAAGMAVGAVDGEDIDISADQLQSAFEKIAGGAEGGAHSKAAVGVLGGIRIFQFLLNVLNGNEATQVVLVVDDEELLHSMFVQDFFRLVEGRADWNGDQFFLGHHLIDGNVEAGFEAEIAVGEDANKFLVLSNWNTGDLVFPHHLDGVGNLIVGRHCDGIDDHAAFRALHLVDFLGLLLDGQVTVHNAEAALLRQRNRHSGFGDGVHGGANDGHVEHDGACQLRLRADFRRNDIGATWNQQNVVEREGFRDGEMNHEILFFGISTYSRGRSRGWQIGYEVITDHFAVVTAPSFGRSPCFHATFPRNLAVRLFKMRPWVHLASWLQAGGTVVSRFYVLPLLREVGLVVLFAVWQLASKRGDLYNILWMLVFGFATLNILALVTRSLDPSGRKRRMAVGEILAVMVVLTCLGLLAAEMLSLFHIFPIKLSPR